MRPGFFLLLGAVLAAGLAALDWETDGFRVVTSGGARQLAVARRPAPIPDVALVDQDGRPFSLGDYRGKPVLVEFIYTRCPTVCGVLGDEFRRVLAETTQGANGRADVALVSISFDPENDDLGALKAYGARYGAAAPLWRIAAAADRRGLAALLRSFGVVVIPDGLGGFLHEGELYVVDADGRLARILDPGAPAQALAAALRASPS